MDDQTATLQRLADEISSLTHKIEDSDQLKTDLKRADDELRRVHEELKAAQQRHTDLIALSLLGHCILNKQGTILELNVTAAALFGMARQNLLQQPITQYILPEDQETFKANLRQLCETGLLQTVELRMVNHDCKQFWARLKFIVQYDAAGTPIYQIIFRDITKRKFQENENELTTHLITLVNRPGDFRERIVSLIASLQNWSGCEAVGIRLRSGEDYPYYETRGFTPGFMRAANHHCTSSKQSTILSESSDKAFSCMCGNIMSGCFDATKEFFTAQGSFWSNNTTTLLANRTETAFLAPGTLRQCNGEGYESVALIPLHNGQHVFGLIQFNDHRPNRFTADLIAHFERMADNLAITLWRRKAEASLEQHSRDLSDRVKELNCLHGLSELGEASGESSELLLQGVAELLPPAWQYPSVTAARITLNGQSFSTANFTPTPWQLQRTLYLHGMQVGSVEVYYLEARPERDEGPFLQREGRLLEVVAKRLGKMLERIHTQRELRESEDRYRTLFSEARDGIALADLANGKLLDCNEALCRMVERKREELIGQPQSILHPQQNLVDGQSLSYRRQSTENSEVVVEDMLLSSREKQIPVEIRAAQISIGGRSCLMGIFRDLSERKQMELHSTRAEKLEAIGTLAAGIAHDFNNLLGAMFLYLELSQEEAAQTQNKKMAEYLSRARDSYDKAKNLTEQLLTFTKNGTPARKTQSLADFVQKTVSFALSGSNTTPVFDIPQGIWLCSFDEGQLSQALNNIIINARQAMPEGGAIEVSLLNLPSEDICNNYPLGDYVKISILDHGNGITPEHLPRIFDPFFSTKKMGSGLGLAASYSIVRQHDGFIEVESSPGKGTTFHIYLPASQEHIPAPATLPEETPKQPYGIKKLLIMDDEELIRSSLTLMLEHMGYRVTAAANSKETAEAVVDSINEGKPFAAAILDLTIPGGRGGKEMIEDLLKLDPNLKVIASSGYSDNLVMSRPADYGFAAALRKPYRKSDLAAVLKTLFSDVKR